MDKEIHFGKGAVKDLPDNRDFQFSDIAGDSAPFDWSKGYDIEKVLGGKIIVKDQNGSSSCGGQAWSYYGAVLDADHDEKSAKFIYSQTFVGSGGSGGRENCSLVIKKGWGSEKLTPSYLNGIPAPESFYQRPQDISSQAFKEALADKALSYANVRIDIDAIAQALRENKGVIIGITGKNNGTWLTEFPQPPLQVDNTCWNHWLYCGKAKLINGKKYIGFINSWGEGAGDKGWQWISEDYFLTTYAIWSAWTLVYDFPIPPSVNYKFTTTMRKGSKYGEVAELQKRMNKEGMANPLLVVDGLFGSKTNQAVENYQVAHGLVVDGIVGKNTRAVLNK